jgi:NADH:ubiquinone oxidoreductase subunit D
MASCYCLALSRLIWTQRVLPARSMELNCVTLVRRALANPLLAAATWMSDVYALTAYLFFLDKPASLYSLIKMFTGMLTE